MYTFIILCLLSATAAQCNTNTLYLSSCISCAAPTSDVVVIPASPERAIDFPPSSQYIVTLYARNITAKKNTQPTTAKLFLDGNSAGMGFQARVSFDYNGDNVFEATSYTSLLPTDGLFGQFETFTPSLGKVSQNLVGGAVKVELWSTFPMSSAGKLRIGAGASTITIPYDDVSYSGSCGSSTPTLSTTSQVTAAPSTTTQAATPSTTASDTCQAMFRQLQCRTASEDPAAVNAASVSSTRGWLCTNYPHHCTAVSGSAIYSTCNSVQQVSYAMNSYYAQFGPTQGANACDFSGLGKIYAVGTTSTTSATTSTTKSTTSTTKSTTSTTSSTQSTSSTSSTSQTPSTTKASDVVVGPAPVVRPITTGTNAKWSALYGSKVTNLNIPSGQRVLLDVASVQADVITIEKGAALVVDNALSSVDIVAAAIIVKGEFWIGTETQPFTSPVNIILSGNTEIVVDNMATGTKVLVVGSGGVLEWHGVKGFDRSWTYLSETAVRGTSTITIADSFANPADSRSWRVGDDIVVAGTDYSPDQAEKVSITKIINGNTFEISPALSYYHHGTITMGVDERAEVGILTRTISVRSGTAGRLGAHVMFLAGSVVHIEGAAGVGLGQDQIARYPFHWHMAGDVTGSYIRHSSVYDSIFRCVTVHSTHNVVVQDVVTMNNYGHCMYLEDGVERGNVFRHNLVTGVKDKTTGERMGSDYGMAVSGFWITSPDNIFEDNVVSGSPGAGYWVHVRMGARGYSTYDKAYNDWRPALMPLRSFKGNKGVGCDHGFQIEATYYDNYNVPQNLVPESPMAAYAPQRNGKDDPVYLDDFTAHHNRFRGLWARAPVVHIRGGKFSNNMEGIQIATSGDHPAPGSIGYVTNCTVIGWSDNIGNADIFNNWQMYNYNRKRSWPRNGIPMVGIAYYDGPQYISDVTFDGWAVDENETPHSAVGTRFHGEFQVASTNALSKCNFKNVTHKSYVSDRNGDGGKVFNFRIPDSTMGLPKGTVLTNWPFYNAVNCMADASVGLLCPQRYSQVWVIDFENRPGNHMVVTRNEHTGTSHKDYELSFAGFHSAGIWRYQPLMSIGAHYLVQFKTTVSQSLAFQLNNAEQGDAVGVAVCYPKGTTIKKVTRGLSNKLGGGLLPPLWESTNYQISPLSTRTAVDNTEGYYYDNSRSILFISVKQRLARANYANFCPDGGCDFVHIDASVPTGVTPVDCTNDAYSGDSLQISSGSWLNTKF